jgi:amphi-Trp domain-containing protein
MTSDSIEIEKMSSAEEAARQLEEIAAGLRRSEYTIRSGSQALTVRFPRELEVKVEAEFNPNKAKWSVDIGLEWRTA